MRIRLRIAVLTAIHALQPQRDRRTKILEEAQLPILDLAVLATYQKPRRPDPGAILPVDEIVQSQPIAEIKLGKDLSRPYHTFRGRRAMTIRSCNNRGDKTARGDPRLRETHAEQKAEQAHAVIVMRQRKLNLADAPQPSGADQRDPCGVQRLRPILFCHLYS